VYLAAVVLGLALLVSPTWLPGTWNAASRRWQEYRSDSLHKEATAHVEAMRYDEAIECMSSAIEVDPEDLVAYMRRRELYFATGQYRRALGDANHLVNRIGRYVDRAEILEELREFDAAIEDCDRALAQLGSSRENFAKEYTERCRAIACKARSLEHCGESSEALDLLSAWIEYSLKLDETPFAQRAVMYSRLGDYEAALADFETGLQLEEHDKSFWDDNPIHVKSPFAHFLASCPDAKYRDGKRALELASLACEITNYKHAAPLTSLAAACAETGDFAGAIKWQQTAIDLAGRFASQDAIERLELYRKREPFRSTVETN
jgi:tetratricopeptide (TPR) repeat protein